MFDVGYFPLITPPNNIDGNGDDTAPPDTLRYK
jgi:hypothetical protein